jgi:spore germination protein YaaH
MSQRPPACVAIALAACHGFASASASPGPSRVGGWAPYWGLDAAVETVVRERKVGDVFMFVAQLDARGRPVLAWPDQDYARAAEAMRGAGATVWLTIVNDVVDASGRTALKAVAVVHGVLRDPARRQEHRRGILALARALGVSGVDVDYENLHASDRAAFSTFVAELGRDLGRAGMMLSVTVQPKAAETGSDGAGAADWGALCRSVDRLQIMLYNEHSAKTGPGPLATVSWVERILAHATRQCSPEKIVAAVKVVGMEWGPDGTSDVPFAKALALARTHGVAVSRHRDGEAPWFTYGANGERTVHYEDARSLSLKLLAARRYGIDRIVLWSLGAEDPELWSVIERLAHAAAAAE